MIYSSPSKIPQFALAKRGQSRLKTASVDMGTSPRLRSWWMTTTNDANRVAQGSGPGAYGPAITFGVAVLAAFAVLIFATATLPKDLVLAAISSLFFSFAALVAVIAWAARKE